MQVSHWLGYADYVVTMTVYAEHLPEQAAANNLPEPPAPEKRAEPATGNVVPLCRA
jgi:integrase